MRRNSTKSEVAGGDRKPERIHLGRNLRVDDNPLIVSTPATYVFSMNVWQEGGKAQRRTIEDAVEELNRQLAPHGSSLVVEKEPSPLEVSSRDRMSTLMLDHGDLPCALESIPATFTPFRLLVEQRGTRYTAPVAPVIEVQANSAELQWRAYLQRGVIDSYKSTRSGLLGEQYSSRLSAALAWGTLSARRVAHDIHLYEQERGANEGTYWLWFELLWRDFFAYRAIADESLINDEKFVAASASQAIHNPFFQHWCRGTLGVSMVDAGMRELAATGYMGNRMRQIVASYLIHELGLPWQWGAWWFATQLVDYCPTSNNGNWKYIAGKGADPRGGRHIDIEKQIDLYDRDARYRTHWGTV